MRAFAGAGGVLVLSLFLGVAACGGGRAQPVWDEAADAATPPFPMGELAPPPAPCEGLGCRRMHCAPGKETTVTGRVLAPNGVTPVPGAVVYVPIAEVPPLAEGASCGCDAPRAVTTTKTAADGSFLLSGVPIGAQVPLVMQLGKWRRVITLPTISACEDRALDEATTRLPRNRSEGDLPRIAVTTGACDALGCLLPKLGIDPEEMGVAGDGESKRVHTFRGAVDKDEVPSGATSAQKLWSEARTLGRYDMVLLACECGEQRERKGERANEAMAEYLDSGGRILTTDYMFTWYRDMRSPGLDRVVSVRGGAGEGGNPVRVSTSGPDGSVFSDWLRAVVPAPARENHARLSAVFDNLASVDPTKARVLASSASPREAAKDVPRIFSLDFPVGAARPDVCGRAVHLDAHVNDSKTVDLVSRAFPLSCSPGLDEPHAALAYLFFHLASCDMPFPPLDAAPTEPVR